MLKRWLTLTSVLTTLMLGAAQPFTYQGFLRVSGNPANGAYDFRFRLYDAASGGAQVGTDQFANDLTVQNGLFTTAIDFGASVWTGADRYLEIAVRPGSSTGGYQELAPRVKINPTPYAIRAATANPIGAAGGDLSGSYPNPTVAGLQGRAVSSSAPSSGQVLKWNGSVWAPANDDIGTSLWQASGSDIFYNAGNVGIGTSNPLYRLHVETNTGDRAIYGFHTATSGTTYGVFGRSASAAGIGVYGVTSGTSGATYGVMGLSASTSGTGARGLATATSGATYGVYGESRSTSGRGVYGVATATSGATYGVYGESDSSNGTGVYGEVTATTGTTYGVMGLSASTAGMGVYGVATATSGATEGVMGLSASTAGRGVYGRADATSGFTYGVYGRSASPDGTGVRGLATATSGFTYGVIGSSTSPDGRGVYGEVTATSGVTFGVLGRSFSTTGRGVYGRADATSGATYGVFGESFSTTGYGVYSAGRFGASGTKAFQIDHPLQPETHFLNHFCTEAPEPLNAYSGVVVLDARGEAWVQLPDYFEAINRDPRYTLTPIGAAMPNLHIAVKIQNNRFKIAGGAPGKEVSWRVEAVRNDRWVQRYGYQTEQEKPEPYQGKYLHPELYGQPRERGIFYSPDPQPALNETGKP
ncbi:MAG: hypothetical protein KatS3mg018_2322 [Fimbriimonadales bacterium]|nr:MAG: hypothetical protein KatS3mg018_2322 [Fimbriimonadales bacterium]